jgi:hypothetical protein
MCRASPARRRDGHRRHFVFDLLVILGRFGVGAMERQLAGRFEVGEQMVGHQVLVHLAHLQQHQVHRVIGNRLQPEFQPLRDAVDGAFFKEVLRAFERAFGEVREDGPRFFGVLPDVRKVVLDEVFQLARTKILDLRAPLVEHRLHEFGEAVERRIRLRRAALHAVHESVISFRLLFGKVLARDRERGLRAIRRACEFGGVAADDQMRGLRAGNGARREEFQDVVLRDRDEFAGLFRGRNDFIGNKFLEVRLHRAEARAEHKRALRGRLFVVAEQAGLRLVFRALKLFELLFARERRVHLRRETLAFELVAIARGAFGYGVVFAGVEEGAFSACFLGSMC